MKQYNVTGMSCAACSARVEKAVNKVPGVTACSVSLLTNSMGVEGTAEPSVIIAAVEAAGYGASEKGAENSGAKVSAAADDDFLKDRPKPRDAHFVSRIVSLKSGYSSRSSSFARFAALKVPAIPVEKHRYSTSSPAFA